MTGAGTARSMGPRTEEELAKEWGGGVIAYADKPGEVINNQQAMARAQSLGVAMVETLKMVK